MKRQITVKSREPLDNRGLRHRCPEYATWFNRPDGLCIILSDTYNGALPDNGFGVYAYDVDCLERVKKVLDCDSGIVMTVIVPRHLRNSRQVDELESRARLCIMIQPE